MPVDVDGKVREWPLSDPATASEDGFGRCHVVLVAVWLHEQHVTDVPERPFQGSPRVEEVIAHPPGALPRHCVHGVGDAPRVPIPFAVSWAEIRGVGEGREDVATPAPGLMKRGGDGRSFYAASMSRLDTLGEGFFRDRIVLVGATHGDIRDRVVTPVGAMPGVVVLANAINGGREAVFQYDRRPLVLFVSAVVAVLSSLIWTLLPRPLGALAVLVLWLLVGTFGLSELRASSLTSQFFLGVVTFVVIWEALLLVAASLTRFTRRGIVRSVFRRRQDAR